jgi:hypothetical protein
VKIIIQSNINAIQQAFKNDAKGLTYATNFALNKTAAAVKQAELSAIRQVFDRPTPYTLNALQLTPSTQDNQTATVWFKGRAKHYLEPQVYGGSRDLRAFESHLQAVGVMPAGTYAVIPRASSWAARIDAYGNLANGLIVQLLSYFSASELWAGHTSNTTAKGKAKRAKVERTQDGHVRIGGMVYFISTGQEHTRHLHPGIWAKKGIHGSNIAPVLLFVKHVSYKQRLDFFGIGRRIVARDLPNNTKIAIAKLLGSSKNR